jgi:hypothetical protein
MDRPKTGHSTDAIKRYLESFIKVPMAQKNKIYQDAILSDNGRYAAYCGYDAIEVTHVKEMVILNRTAVIVQDTNVKREHE